MKQFILSFLLLAACVSCGRKERIIEIEGQQLTVTEEEASAMEFLYEAMPLSDRLNYPPEYFLDQVKAAMRARSEMPWGQEISDSLFLHFVLPPRVNNENLDNFRETYYPVLKERVSGLGAEEAALEVNHWLHEHVSYAPSDARTSSPMATIVNAKGRCGEESVLAVSALRTVGLPARQVYTPRWAHTDDNHAWVEVYVDGQWKFLGACEPEPVLNRAWFNAPASRGMLMRAQAYGDYKGHEQRLASNNNMTEINVTGNYVPVRESQVQVVRPDGSAADSVKVEFMIYNYAEFYPAVTMVADSEGKATLTTGCGDMLAWASDGENFGYVKISDDNNPATLVLDHKIGEPMRADFVIIPPDENPIPDNATEEGIALNAKRLAQEDSIRSAYEATFYDGDDEGERGDLLRKSRGNWRHIEAFLDSTPEDRMDEAIGMLEAVSEKDLRDTPATVFIATLRATTSQPENPLYIEYVLNPRIAGELLTPYRAEIASKGLDAQGIIDYVAKNVKIETLKGASYRMPVRPMAVERAMVADPASRDIYFVALCRNEGIPARINPIDQQAQYHDGSDWVDVNFGDVEMEAEAVVAEKGDLALHFTAIPYISDPQYYRHFTISDMSSGYPCLLEYPEDATCQSMSREGVKVAPGYYMLTSGTRMADGSVMAHIEMAPVEANKTTSMRVTLPTPTDQLRVIGNFDCEAPYLPAGADESASILSTTGRGYFILAVLGGPGNEPSNHARHELAAAAEAINAWGRPVLVLTPDGAEVAELSGLERAYYGKDIDGTIAKMLRAGTESRRNDLPVVIVGDSFGRIVLYSEGYDTALGEKLKRL